MPRQKPRYQREAEERIVCPCCEKSVAVSSAKKTIGRSYFSWGVHSLLEAKELQSGHFHWACDQCLTTGKALHAFPEKQLYCDYNPYFAYYDRSATCRSCNDKFVFTAGEQQFWYEKLGFWVQSVPVRCPECRKQLRRKKALNTELAELLKKKDEAGKGVLQRIAAIYRFMGNEAKSRQYERLAEKKSV